MKKLILYTFCFIAAIYQAQGQIDLSLNDAIAIGLDKSLSSEIIQKQIEINENNNIKANTGTSPSVTLNARIPFSFSKTYGDRFFTFGLVPEDSRTNYSGQQDFSIDGQWPLYTGGRGSLLQEQLDLTISQSELNLNQDEQVKVLDIVQSYHNVTLQQERLAVIRELMNLSTDRIEFEEIKKEFGTSNSFNILQLEDALLNDSTDLVNQHTQVEIAMRQLMRDLNEELNTDAYRINQSLEGNYLPLDENILIAELLENNIDLSNLDLNKKFAAVNSKLQSTFRKPNLSANSSLGFTRNRSGFFGVNPRTGESIPLSTTRNYGFNIGLTASYNLFDGGIIKSNIANAKLEEEIAALSYENVREDLEAQLLNLVNQYNSSLELLKIIESKLLLVQQNIGIAEERFKSGAINSFDYRNVQLSYLNTSFSKLQILFDIIITKSNIDWLTGEYSTIK